MSPVSRGRGKKHRSSKGPRAQRAANRRRTSSAPDRAPASMLSGVDIVAQSRSWWPDSHAELIDEAACLLDCATPAALEDATCRLIGEHWRRQCAAHTTGLKLHAWLARLLDTTCDHSAAAPVQRLVTGIALITEPELAELALDVLGSIEPGEQRPPWDDVQPAAVVSPDAWVLRDGYGLRFGVVAQVTRPGGAVQPYLFDIDWCHGWPMVLGSGYVSDLDDAVRTWRESVGEAASRAEPEPASPELLGAVLPAGGSLDWIFTWPTTEQQFVELFRVDRVMIALVRAMGAAGRPVRWPDAAPGTVEAIRARLLEDFRTWSDGHAAELPDGADAGAEVAEWVVEDWVTNGMPEFMASACSPHRIGAFLAYLHNDWQEASLRQATPLLEPFVRFCLDRTGVDAALSAATLERCRLGLDQPDGISWLGNHLNRPLDEMTLEGPPLVDTV